MSVVKPSTPPRFSQPCEGLGIEGPCRIRQESGSLESHRLVISPMLNGVIGNIYVWSLKGARTSLSFAGLAPLSG